MNLSFASPSSRLHPWIVLAIAWVVAFDLAWMWQRAGGVYASELGGHPDEAAHYVTGLMARDYLASGLSAPPMKFAEAYYGHYPKIGLGVWPPVFYGLQALWTLPLGESRTSVLLLMAVLAATVGAMVFAALREEFGNALAALGGALMLSLPLFREAYGMVMAETLSAIFMFGAALFWGRFLDQARRADALWFGLFAGLSIMTKGTGIALVIQAPLALALAGRWVLLKRPVLWGGAAIAGILAGPWTWIFRNYGRDKGGWLESGFSWSFVREALPYYAGKLGLALGILLLLLMCAGIAVRVLRRGPRHAQWMSMLSLIIAVYAFQVAMPVGLEARHLIPALPAAVMFAVAGLHAVGTRFQRPPATTDSASPALAPVPLVLVAILGLGGAVVAYFMTPRDSRKEWSGFEALAQQVLKDSASKGAVLVSSDARGEGMFISELAARDRRPGRVVKRANKELAKMDWAGRDVRPRFENSEELTAWISRASIDYVVVDTSMPDDKHGAHHDQLRRAAEDHPEVFWPMTETAAIRGGITSPEPVKLYRIRHTATMN